MEYLQVGVAVKPQGIRGELKVRVLLDDAQALESLRTVYTRDADEWRAYDVLSARAAGGFAYVALGGVADRNAAEQMRNAKLFARRADIPLPKDAHYIGDLIGLSVSDEKGNVLGTLEKVIRTGAADVYVVRNAAGGFMFPALKKVIREVDADARVMTLDAGRLAEVVVHEI